MDNLEESCSRNRTLSHTSPWIRPKGLYHSAYFAPMRSVAGDIAYVIGKHTRHNVTVPTSRPLPHCTLGKSIETLQLERLARVVSHQQLAINILHGEGQRCYLNRIHGYLRGCCVALAKWLSLPLEKEKTY